MEKLSKIVLTFWIFLSFILMLFYFSFEETFKLGVATIGQFWFGIGLVGTVRTIKNKNLNSNLIFLIFDLVGATTMIAGLISEFNLLNNPNLNKLYFSIPFFIIAFIIFIEAYIRDTSQVYTKQIPSKVYMTLGAVFLTFGIIFVIMF